MAISTQPYKGARDFYPKDKQVQNYIFNTWRDVATSFGYEEYDASIIEPIDLYLAKTSQEIVNEQTYTFEDRGGRKVTLRPEMTPSVSRMVAARRQELAYPLRWFSIPNVWRYERPQRGRLREHWQLNVDLFGVANTTAEHELILLADAIMQKFGAQRDMYEIRISSRTLVNSLMKDYLKFNDSQAEATVRIIDRMKKMETAEFEAQIDAVLTPTQREDGHTAAALRSFCYSPSWDDVPADFLNSDAIAQLRKLREMLSGVGITNVFLVPTLMRGFDYYTDIVFEVFDTAPENNRSMFGGGRYDGLVGMFGVEPVPTVGFGMGDVTIKDFLETHNLLPNIPTNTDLTVLLIGDDVYAGAQDTIKQLRDAGINVAVDATGRKMEKQIKSASKAGVSKALFIGENEFASGQFSFKDLESGQTSTLTLPEVIELFSTKA